MISASAAFTTATYSSSISYVMPAAVKCGVDAVSTGPRTVILGNWVRIDLGTFLDRKLVEKTVIAFRLTTTNTLGFALIRTSAGNA
ncbi:hypothetical protein TSUKUMMB_41530 [Rhodococcus sp. no. 34]